MRLDQRLKPALLFRKELLEEGIGHVLASSPPPAPMVMQPGKGVITRLQRGPFHRHPLVAVKGVGGLFAGIAKNLHAAYNAGNYSIASSFEAAARSLAAAVEDREARLHYFREHNYEGE